MRTTCCLAEWMPPARMRVLTGVLRAGRAHDDRADRRARCKRRQQPPARLVAADHADQRRAAAERGDVVGGVAGAAGHDLGRVVLEDQHRRLARDARHAAVDELVGDEVADDGDASGPSARRSARGAAQNPPDGLHQIVEDSIRRATAVGAAHRLLVRAVAGAHQHRARAGRAPARHVEPAVADHDRPRGIEVHLAARLLDHARARLAAAARLPIALDRRVRDGAGRSSSVDARRPRGQARVDRRVHVVRETARR